MWNNSGKGVVPYPPLNLSVVAKEKEAFELPLATVANFTFIYNSI